MQLKPSCIHLKTPRNRLFPQTSAGRCLLSAAAAMQQAAGCSSGTAVHKPLCDRRLYQHAVLENGVKVLVIQDTDAMYAAASANVQVGYFDDQGLPGAAHFVEHMVHLGSKKFPDEKEYKSFLAQHGGTSNASTSMVHTRCHFKVHSNGLQGALHRFGAMLSCPLITHDSSAREVENVHAEYSRNTNSDARQLLQLRRSLCSAPYSNFSTGSMTTLWEAPKQQGKDVPGALRELWQQYYKADATCITVVGPQEPQLLLQWVQESFSDMPSSSSSDSSSGAHGCGSVNSNADACLPDEGTAALPSATCDTSKPSEQPQQQQQADSQAKPHSSIPAVNGSSGSNGSAGQRYPCEVVAPGSLGNLVLVCPQRDLRELELSWYIPAGVMLHSSCKPWQWASHLIGHEGPGSVAHLLKAQGLVQSLVAGMGEEVRLGRGWMFWRVQVSLTMAGEGAVQHVVGSVFRAVQVLQRCSEHQLQQTWQEAAALAQLRFDWRDPTDPLTAAQSAAYSLHYYPADKTLSGPSLMTSFEPQVLRWFVEQLTPHNMNVFWSSRRHAQAVDSKERWYGAQYAVQQLPQDWLNTIEQYQSVDRGASASSSSGSSSSNDGGICSTAAAAGAEQQQHLQPVPGQLHLPEPNWALPEDLALRYEDGAAAAAAAAVSGTGCAAAAAGVADAAAAPDVLLEQPGLCVWHKRDISFGLPKVHLKLHLVTPAVYASPAAAVSTRLLLRVIEDLLLPLTYPAELAGSSYTLSSEHGGLALKVVGFPGVVQQLLQLVLQGVLDLTLQQVVDRFATMSGRLTQALTNWANNNPAQHAEYGSHHLLQLQHHHNVQLLEAAAAAAPEHLLALQRQLVTGRDLHVDMLAYGNISRQEAADVMVQLQQLLKPQGLQEGCWPPAGRVLCLSHVPLDIVSAATAAKALAAATGAAAAEHAEVQEGPTAAAVTAAAAAAAALSSNSAVYVTYLPNNPNSGNSNSAVNYIIQLGPDSVQTSVLLDLFVQMSSKAAFYELRTKQRLGYSVSLSSSKLHRQLGLQVRVQSPSTAPDALAAAIRSWLAGFRAELQEKATQQLDNQKKALRDKYLDPAKSLHEAAKRAWTPIRGRSLMFDRRQQKAAAVEALTAEQLLQLYDAVLHPEGPKHRALCVEIWGGKTSGAAVAAVAAAVVLPQGKVGQGVCSSAAPAAEILQEQQQPAVEQQQQQQRRRVTVLAHEVDVFKQSQPLMPLADMRLPPAAATAPLKASSL